MTEKCKSCGAMVLWVLLVSENNPAGKAHPLDGAGDGIMFCGCLEVKHPVTGRLTPSQAVYKPAAESLGILYEVVTTPEEAEAAVKQWRKAICEFFAARSKQPKKRKAKR